MLWGLQPTANQGFHTVLLFSVEEIIQEIIMSSCQSKEFSP